MSAVARSERKDDCSHVCPPLSWQAHREAHIVWAVEAKRQEIRVETLNEPISHYADAVRAGNLVFVSGCAPLDRDGRLVGGDDVLAQARQVLSNMRDVLAAAGATFADVAKITVYLADRDDRETVNAARREFFGETRPASTLIEPRRLALEGMRVEIDCIAVIPGPESG